RSESEYEEEGTLSVDKGISLSFSKEASATARIRDHLLDYVDDYRQPIGVKHFEELGDAPELADHTAPRCFEGWATSESGGNAGFSTAERKKLKDELRRMKERDALKYLNSVTLEGHAFCYGWRLSTPSNMFRNPRDVVLEFGGSSLPREVGACDSANAEIFNGNTKRVENLNPVWRRSRRASERKPVLINCRHFSYTRSCTKDVVGSRSPLLQSRSWDFSG
ncbi:hypothetical protein Dimus_036019, partial [Dionaea muscipula]